MRYFIFFGYDGTNYHGWQIQPNANSVQQELQRALSILLRKEMEVVGAGRTDTGVHARHMTAHFDTDRIPMEPDQLVYRLNRILPRDIAVYEVREVAPEMHARFSKLSPEFREDERGGSAFSASRRLCSVLQGGWRQQDHHLPRNSRPMDTDLSYHLVFRDYRQPFPEKHGESRSGNTHRCRQRKDYDGTVSQYPAQRKPQRCRRKHAG